MAELIFRDATASDAEQLSMLLGELGYPSPPSEIPARLVALGGIGKSLALVAVMGGEAVGLITAMIYPSIHRREPACLITSLVVSSDAREHGIGSELVARAEDWAAGNGAGRISVGSGSHRVDTHRFYERRGYDRTGIRFGKQLNGISGVEPA